MKHWRRSCPPQPDSVCGLFCEIVEDVRFFGSQSDRDEMTASVDAVIRDPERDPRDAVAALLGLAYLYRSQSEEAAKHALREARARLKRLPSGEE